VRHHSPVLRSQTRTSICLCAAVALTSTSSGCIADEIHVPFLPQARSRLPSNDPHAIVSIGTEVFRLMKSADAVHAGFSAAHPPFSAAVSVLQIVQLVAAALLPRLCGFRACGIACVSKCTSTTQGDCQRPEMSGICYRKSCDSCISLCRVVPGHPLRGWVPSLVTSPWPDLLMLRAADRMVHSV
jgi:hypothetical protein